MYLIQLSLMTKKDFQIFFHYNRSLIVLDYNIHIDSDYLINFYEIRHKNKFLKMSIQ